MVYIVIAVVLLYLWAIMPRIFGRPDYSVLSGYYYAHRGLHDHSKGIPENSLKAFKRAVQGGFGIELDVQLTKDEEVVVFHDFDLRRVCGIDKKVRDLTYRELEECRLLGTEERIPRLEDVLKAVGGRVPLIVEMKLEDKNTRVCELANNYLYFYQGPYCIESFSPFAVRWFRRHRPGVIRGQLSMKFKKKSPAILYWALSHLLFNFWVRPDFIAYDRRNMYELSRRMCRRLFGSPAAAWTIRSQEQLDEAKKQFDLFIFEKFIPNDHA